MGRGGASIAGKTSKLLDAPRTRPPHLLSSSVLFSGLHSLRRRSRIDEDATAKRRSDEGSGTGMVVLNELLSVSCQTKVELEKDNVSVVDGVVGSTQFHAPLESETALNLVAAPVVVASKKRIASGVPESNPLGDVENTSPYPNMPLRGPKISFSPIVRSRRVTHSPANGFDVVDIV